MSPSGICCATFFNTALKINALEKQICALFSRRPTGECLVIEPDGFLDVGMEAVGDGAAVGGGFDDFLFFVGIVVAFGEVEVDDDFGDPAGVGGHYLFNFQCGAVYAESIVLGGESDDGKHA